MTDCMWHQSVVVLADSCQLHCGVSVKSIKPLPVGSAKREVSKPHFRPAHTPVIFNLSESRSGFLLRGSGGADHPKATLPSLRLHSLESPEMQQQQDTRWISQA